MASAATPVAVATTAVVLPGMFAAAASVAVAAVGQGRRGKQAHTHPRCKRQGERS
jgi:hypothetical protein